MSAWRYPVSLLFSHGLSLWEALSRLVDLLASARRGGGRIGRLGQVRTWPQLFLMSIKRRAQPSTNSRPRLAGGFVMRPEARLPPVLPAFVNREALRDSA